MSTISSLSSPSPHDAAASGGADGSRGAVGATIRWRPVVGAGRGLRALHPPARYLRPAAGAVLAVALLGTLWLPLGHVVPAADLSHAAPREAGRLVAGVRERHPAPTAAPGASGAASATVAAEEPAGIPGERPGDGSGGSDGTTGQGQDG